jgi:ABC-type multidrug transport system permease subunit
MNKLINDKRGQIFDSEILTSMAFFVSLGIGYLMFAIIMFWMKQSGTPLLWWVKIVGALLIPVAAYIFALREENR